MPSDPTVRLQTLGGTWETCGVDRFRGIVPQGLSMSSNGWGSDTCSFTLRRKAGALHPDLAAFTPCDIEIDGVKVWSGRVRETPTQSGADDTVSVEGQGWQYHLDDDVYQRSYVQTDMARWGDVRGLTTADIAVTWPNAYEVTASDTGIMLSLPAGKTAPASSQAGAFIDTGPGDTAGVKRVVVTYKGGGLASLGLAVRNAASTFTTGGDEASTIDAAPIATVSTTAAFTFATARRFLAISMDNNAGVGLAGASTGWVQILAVQIFRSTAYESANASILKASDVIADAATIATLLSTDTTGIAATSFSIPDFALDGNRSPREVMEAANAYHNYILKIDPEKRVVFKARPTAPLFEVGEWSGADFTDASANSGEEIYDQVIVEGTGPDGVALQAKRTQTGTLVDRRSFHRTKILPVRSALTTAMANQIGDTFLLAHKSTPLRGDLRVTHGGARTVLGGRRVRPAELLLHTGEMVRLTNRIDPDTGAWGRDGTIAAVSYDFDTDTANLTVDNQRDNLEALLERLAVVTGSR